MQENLQEKVQKWREKKTWKGPYKVINITEK
jgi:hypothetical protein